MEKNQFSLFATSVISVIPELQRHWQIQRECWLGQQWRSRLWRALQTNHIRHSKVLPLLSADLVDFASIQNVLDTPNNDNYSPKLASDLPGQTCTPIWSSINFNRAPCGFGGRSGGFHGWLLGDPRSDQNLGAWKCPTGCSGCLSASVVPGCTALNSAITFGKSTWG